MTCISWSSDFSQHFKHYFIELHYTWVNVLGQHGPVTYVNISYSILWIGTVLGLMHWVKTKSDLTLVVGHCDLYFMVQWFEQILLTTLLTCIILGVMVI